MSKGYQYPDPNGENFKNEPEFCKECGIEKDYWGMCPKCCNQPPCMANMKFGVIECCECEWSEK